MQPFIQRLCVKHSGWRGLVLGMGHRDNLLPGRPQSPGQGTPPPPCCMASALTNQHTGTWAHRCIVARKGEELGRKGARHSWDFSV